MPAPEPVTKDPFNAHTPVRELAADVTPTDAFFVRNHFRVPDVDAGGWRLTIGGAVDAPREVTLADLDGLPTRDVLTVMECAGNGRTRMRPLPPGTGWGDRAVGCARFTGVPLREVLAACGVRPDASEILFRGADRGKVETGEEVHYERSLPVDVALHPDTILAFRMNDQPLTPDHGAPVRLLVPGWYGMASVKWLVEVRALTEPFKGFFQTNHYVYRDRVDEADAPVGHMRVKSLVLDPAEDATVPAGEETVIRGRAWSGGVAVTRVEVSVDGGETWETADLDDEQGPYAWRAWSLAWRPEDPGDAAILARAYAADGSVQPLDAEWNALGYGYNAADARRVRVTAR